MCIQSGVPTGHTSTRATSTGVGVNRLFVGNSYDRQQGNNGKRDGKQVSIGNRPGGGNDTQNFLGGICGGGKCIGGKHSQPNDFANCLMGCIGSG